MTSTISPSPTDSGYGTAAVGMGDWRRGEAVAEDWSGEEGGGGVGWSGGGDGSEVHETPVLSSSHAECTGADDGIEAVYEEPPPSSHTVCRGTDGLPPSSYSTVHNHTLQLPHPPPPRLFEAPTVRRSSPPIERHAALSRPDVEIPPVDGAVSDRFEPGRFHGERELIERAQVSLQKFQSIVSLQDGGNGGNTADSGI